jgi:thiol:disulfide interchange protein
VAAVLGRIAPVRLDVTRNTSADREIQSRYSVRGLPTVILLDSRGKEKARFVGFKGPAGFLAWVKPHLPPGAADGDGRPADP